MKEKYLLNIKADEAPGLLSRVLIMLSRRRLEVETVTMSRTDISSVVLITIEIIIDGGAVQNLCLQLEKIIEVFSTEALPNHAAKVEKLAYYKLSNGILQSSQGVSIQKYGAHLVNLYPDSFVISKSGSPAIINELYRVLEGKFLLGFAQTGPLANSSFLESNDEWRISKLAA